MIEIFPETDRGFIYRTESLSSLELHVLKESVVEKTEYVEGNRIDAVIIKYATSPDSTINLSSLGNITCKHGAPLNYASINRLPQEGWDELIDCWSCHNGEFKSMLDRKIYPREHGILTSNFYLIAHPTTLPACCQSTPTLYYNDLTTKYTDRNYIFLFFEEFFQSKGTMVIEKDRECIEIKCFYKCIWIKEHITWAMKIGFRKTDKMVSNCCFINDYYISKIFEEITETAINVSALGYNLAFIRQS